MASSAGASTPAAGASTPGAAGASTPGLRIATWNVGLPQADSFKKGNKIDEHLGVLAETLVEMLCQVDMVAINELHPEHHGRLNELLAEAGGIAFLGFAIGDAMCWRR